MTYNLYFHPLALKEWKKLAPSFQQQFKKALKKRLESPHTKVQLYAENLKTATR
jgi:mRNA interferase RelE/StbE